MSQLIHPKDYKALLNMHKTEQGIKLIKDFFQQNLSTELRLRRVTAPLFVMQGLGINDDLNGVERPVTFPIKDLGDRKAEVVHSLAKWKRLTLADYHIPTGHGIYTDMNAIRADEELDNLHSLYVDQWDWEAVIEKKDRTLAFLKNVVERIYAAIRRTEYLVCETYDSIKPFLPEKIHFVHSEELLQMYPDLTPKEREDAICKKYGAVFVIGIGGKLSDGKNMMGVPLTMTIGQPLPKMAWQDLMVTFLFGIPCLNAHLNYHQWVFVLIKKPSCTNSKLRVKSNVNHSTFTNAY